MASFVHGFITAGTIYLALGFLFAAAFVLKGVVKIDPNAASGTWGFRLAIFPASMVFWPLLLRRWISGSSVPPTECSPHRNASGGCGCRCGDRKNGAVE